MRIGMGVLGDAATCPSLEQLQGLVDMDVPCQNPVAGLPVLGTPTPSSTPGSVAYTSSATLAAGAATPTASTTKLLYVGLAAVGAMLLIGMMRK